MRQQKRSRKSRHASAGVSMRRQHAAAAVSSKSQQASAVVSRSQRATADSHAGRSITDHVSCAFYTPNPRSTVAYPIYLGCSSCGLCFLTLDLSKGRHGTVLRDKPLAVGGRRLRCAPVTTHMHYLNTSARRMDLADVESRTGARRHNLPRSGDTDVQMYGDMFTAVSCSDDNSLGFWTK